jgi:hypothetical protein
LTPRNRPPWSPGGEYDEKFRDLPKNWAFYTNHLQPEFGNADATSPSRFKAKLIDGNYQLQIGGEPLMPEIA